MREKILFEDKIETISCRKESKKMSSTNSNSPLYKIRTTLKILRWAGGFPLQTLDPSFSQFAFIPWKEYARFAILIVMLVSEYIYWALIVLIYDGNIDNLFSFYEESYDKFSSSKVDQFSTLFIYITAISFNVMLLFVFKCNAFTMSQSFKDAKKLKSSLSSLIIKNEEKRKPVMVCHKMEKCTKTILYGQSLNIAASIVWGIWAALFIQIHYGSRMDVYGNSIGVTYPFFHAFQASIILFGPLVCSAELVARQIVDNLTDLFSLWEEILKYGSNGILKEHTNKPQLNNSRSLVLDLEPDIT